MGNSPTNQSEPGSSPPLELNRRFARIGHNLCWGGALLLILAGALALILSSCHPRRRASGPGPERITSSLPSPRDVKVRLFHDLDRVGISTSSLCRWDSGSDSSWTDKSYRSSRTISAADGTIYVDGENTHSATLHVRPSNNLFEVKGRNYRGNLTVSLNEDDRLVLMEKLPLEDYIRSVVPSEMPARWPMAALKAQAITARTFALHRMTNRNGRRWMSRLDMAYRGTYGESARSDAAVRQTRGRILRWDGDPLPAFFHSTCGGHTVSAKSVFGTYDIPPLQGTKCTWGKNSRYYRWESSLSTETLEQKLRSRGIENVDSLTVADRDKFGRVTEVRVNTDKHIPAPDFRLDVGSRAIKSTWFSVAPDGNEYRFTGRGWGHGVGLCQHGAFGMAQDGRGWREILHFYFPHAPIGTIRSYHR